MKITRIGFIWIAIVILLVGCSKPEVLLIEDQELTILSTTDHINGYLKYYEIQYPDVQLNVINARALMSKEKNEDKLSSNDLMLKVLKDQINRPDAPDLIFTNNPFDIYHLIGEGLLKPLEPFIDEHHFDIDGIAPFVREGLRDIGEGTLYAMTPTFDSSALYYNKAIFDQKGVPYPTDRMTWDEILNLAKQLSYEDENGEMVYGLTISLGDLYSQMSFYASQLNLTKYDPEFAHLNVETPSWEHVWNLFIELEKEKVIAPTADWNEFSQGLNFISGRTAMQIISASTIKDVALHVQDGAKVKGVEPFDWDVVTVPVHTERPDLGLTLQYDALMAITNKDGDSELAWELISYLHSDKVAKQLAKSPWNIVSRMEYIASPAGMELNVASFGYLRPPSIHEDSEVDINTDIKIIELARNEFQKARSGEKSVDQALHDLQTKGQEILDQFLLNK